MDKHEVVIAVMTGLYILFSALAAVLPAGSKLQRFCAFVSLAFKGAAPKKEGEK